MCSRAAGLCDPTASLLAAHTALALPPLAAPGLQDSEFGSFIEAALRGHLLMQLDARAQRAGISGTPPQLQAMLRPLECLLRWQRPAAPEKAAEALLELASSQVR